MAIRSRAMSPGRSLFPGDGGLGISSSSRDGACLRHLVKVHVRRSDRSLFAGCNAVYARRFSTYIRRARQ
jgi:hypothetical protein